MCIHKHTSLNACASADFKRGFGELTGSPIWLEHGFLDMDHQVVADCGLCAVVEVHHVVAVELEPLPLLNTDVTK